MARATDLQLPPLPSLVHSSQRPIYLLRFQQVHNLICFHNVLDTACFVNSAHATKTSPSPECVPPSALCVVPPTLLIASVNVHPMQSTSAGLSKSMIICKSCQECEERKETLTRKTRNAEHQPHRVESPKAAHRLETRIFKLSNLEHLHPWAPCAFVMLMISFYHE